VRFVDCGELELSSNLAGNALRGVALGRKNRIHLGSAEAGPKVTATSIQRVGELTPARWAAS